VIKPNLFEAFTVILIEHGGEYLLLHRADTKLRQPGRWTGVGGRVEPDELDDLKASAWRELKEETGFDASRVEDFAFRRALLVARPGGPLVLLLYFTGHLNGFALPDCPEGTLHWMAPEQFAGVDIIETSRQVLDLLVTDQGRDSQGQEPVKLGVGVFDPGGSFSHILWE
jgi:8-oxo-dGTP diphosphatase